MEFKEGQNDRPDLYIIQKQTALERYSQLPAAAHFQDYLHQDEPHLARLTAAHSSHTKSRELLLSALNESGFSYTLLTIDELLSAQIPYHQTDGSGGLRSNLGVVLALGGDGTLLHSSHFCGGETALVGINSSPEHSIGHLCALNRDDISRIPTILHSGENLTFKKVRRLKTESAQAPNLPLALNDILFCHKHPAVMSRYQIDLIHSEHPSERVSERHHSSGVWVATPAGSTAAIRGYGLPTPDLTTEAFLMAVRELYPRPERSYSLCTRFLEGACYSLEFRCRMRQGMVWIDGPDACAELGFGDTIRISIPVEAQLKLAIPGKPKVQMNQTGENR